MSEDKYNNPTHIMENLEQVILTSYGERPMNPEFGSEVDTSIFEVDSQSSKTMIEFQAKEAIKAHLSDRLSLKDLNAYSQDSSIYVSVSFSATGFSNREVFVENIEVGDVNA